jgi:hypothetical protein
MIKLTNYHFLNLTTAMYNANYCSRLSKQTGLRQDQKMEGNIQA